MAGLKIEGDCSQINDKQLEFIKSVIEKQGFKDNKVIIGALGKAGDNYMANVMRVVVEDDNGSPLKMVVKIAPQNEIQRAFGNTEAVFRNEHIMYTKVLPNFSQLEETHNVPLQDRLRYPICYGSSHEAPNEIILLEDLNESNFSMLSRFESLNMDCIKSILKNLALLHSLGFALRYKEPEAFDGYIKSFFDVFGKLHSSDDAVLIFKGLEVNTINILDSDFHKETIKRVIKEPIHSFAKLGKIDLDSKYSVIQHGDAWTNNFLFNYDGDSVQCLIIDYQTAKASSPVTDLLFMISSCTDYEFRKEHFSELIDYYHGVINKSMSYYGLDTNIVYSRDQLNADLKTYGKVTFGHTIFMLAMIALKPEEALVMKQAMEKADMQTISKHSGAATSKDPETVAKFKKTIEGLIDSYHEFGLL